ncbi:MAG: non-canonical purine NTP diphosphatase [Bacteroidaceae bacterium]|nr:non-canonical purine NTP diphosphatase [Bacteroidaceae bacterium]
MKLVFATNNKHKLQEVRDIVGNRVEVLSLSDIGCCDDIPETADTLQGNALIKARHICGKYGLDCFADDTGLEVEALGGAPGVYSARYAGEECDSEANMRKLLENLTGKSNRNAQFRTVIALIIDGKEMLFDGIVKGTIATEKKGDSGFGYDPIFIPEGHTESFAQMSGEMKNSMSHRFRATQQLGDYLKENYG